MVAGHGGRSGRYDAWRDYAFELAFLLDQMTRELPVAVEPPAEPLLPASSVAPPAAGFGARYGEEAGGQTETVRAPEDAGAPTAPPVAPAAPGAPA